MGRWAGAPSVTCGNGVVWDAEAVTVLDGPPATVDDIPSRPASWWRRRRRWAWLASLGLGVVLITLTAAVSGPPSRHPPVPASHGIMPSFRVGAVRLWDSGTQWVNIEPDRGTFDWAALDREVAGAQSAGLPVLFTFGGTPGWASPAGPVGPYREKPRTTPPDDLADWDVFVAALVGRYQGRIEAYELWVLATDIRFYNGSVETLVAMTRRASGIIRAADPKATVVCPGMGNLWAPDGRRMLQRFAELGGYSYCDVASVKLYQRMTSDPPETMVELATTIDRAFHEAGVHPPLWSTGTFYQISSQERLPEEQARNFAVRFYLAGIYARSVNLERMYFYNWGGIKIPIVLQAVDGAPTQAALAVEQLQRWLVHAQSRACGHGLAIRLPDNVWQCLFTIVESDRRYDATIRWTDHGIATTTAGPGVATIHRLDGSTTAVQPGDTITVTEEPILIDHRP